MGIDQRVWTCLESGGFGVDATSGEFPQATDGIEHTSCKIDFNIPRDDAAHRSGRSKVTRLSGKKDVKFSFETYIIPTEPTGNNPNLPDSHPMLLSVFGACAEGDTSKKVYTLARTSTTSFRLLEEGTHFSRLAVGCVCDTVTFTLPGDGKAMVKFEGFGQDAFFCGESTLSIGATANTLTLQTGHGSRFEVGGYVDVIDKDDGDTVKAQSREITGINGDVLTVDGAVITADTSDIVIGSTPNAFTAEPSENALLGLKGSFETDNFGTIDADLLSAEISVKNNYSPRANTYGTSKITGFLADKRREVSVKLEILLTKDNVDFYTTNKVFTADGLTITLEPQDIPAPAVSDGDARTFTFSMPRVEFNVSALEQPSDGPIKLTLEGTCLSTDTETQGAELSLEIS